MKSLAVAFTGPSDSGKTTLILKVANILKKEYVKAIQKLNKITKEVPESELAAESHLAIGDDAKARQVPVMVEHQMQLDCALGGAELCPVIHGKAQIDDGRIDADQFVLEAKLLLAHHFGGDRLEQAVEDLLEQFPRSMAVGVGQRRARRRFDAQVSELALATLQPALDLSQGVGSAKLTEQHADELAPARQPLAAVFRSCLFHDAFKIGAWNKLEHLAEHAA